VPADVRPYHPGPSAAGRRTLRCAVAARKSPLCFPAWTHRMRWPRPKRCCRPCAAWPCGMCAVCTFAQHRAPVRPPVPIGGFDGWAGTAALPLYAAKLKWDGCRGDVLRSPATARSAAVQARVTAVAARHHPGRCAARLGQSQSRELVVLKAQATGQ
jgi:hypothetical protein